MPSKVGNSGPGRPLLAASGGSALERRDEEWLVEELLSRRTAAELVEGLVARGYPRSLAEQSVSNLVDSPIFQRAADAAKSNRKMAGLLKAMGKLFLHSGFELQRRRISSTEFYRDFFFNNRPVVLKGLMDDWSAVDRWTPEYFKSRYGHAVVEVMVGRDDDPEYDLNFVSHRANMSMADYVDRITSTESGNDCYLVARNHVLNIPEMASLSADFRNPAGFLNPDSTEDPYVRFWLGPAGTLTPFHCDDCNIMFGQVTGRKRVRLVPPYFYPSLYNTTEYSSSVDLDNIDLASFPAMEGVPILEVVLEPGEFLFIPIGWWHWVRSLELSTSLTFTNFYNDDPPVMWPELLE